MRVSIKKFALMLMAVTAVLLLPACQDAGGEVLPPEAEEGVLIFASLNPMTYEVQTLINRFNNSHTDVKIEVRDYSDEGGVQRLLTELTLGNVPDIIELHKLGELGPLGDVAMWSAANMDHREGEYWLPYRQMAQKGYLEDLWPYIENDPELGREGVVEGPLKAAEVGDGLYMVFMDASIVTLFGEESVVGERSGWTLEELMETFAAMTEDSTIMRFNATRRDIFFRLICTALDQYIDWETGECSFDSEDFRSILEFLNSLPAEFETTLSSEEVNEELARRAFGGRQMLEATVLSSLNTMVYMDAYWGPDKYGSYVGFPTADGSSGSFFRPDGSIMAMSSGCEDKEAAWEFIRQLIVKSYDKESIKTARWASELNIPVNKEDYELGNWFDLSEPPEDLPPYRPFTGGPAVKVYPPAEEHLQRFEALINSITQLYWPDDAVSEIVWDAAGAYFAGDRSLDDAIAMIQNRVQLYVNESR